MRGHSILAAFVPPPYLGTPLVLRLLLVSGAAGLALLVLLGPADGTLAAAAWTRLELTFASSVSLVTALLSIPGTTGRVRRVRSWMSAAIGFWLMGEMIRNAELAFGHDAAASLSDLPFIGVLVCAGLGYAAALKGQLRPSEALAVYLDGAIVFFATAALMLTAFGHAAGGSLSGGMDLAYAIFFLATAGATLLLDMAVRAERRLSGPYAALAGLLLLGIGFLWRVAAPPSVGLHESGPPAHFISLGVLFVMVGVVTWTDVMDEHAGYVRLTRRVRSAMPLVAIGLMPAVVVIQFVSELPGPIAAVNRAAIALVLLTVAIRQSVLLRDREAAVEREQALGGDLAAAEARYRALVERQPGVVYVAEPGKHGSWHYVSPQIERMLGYPPEAWVEDPTFWARQIHPEDRSAVLGEEDDLITGRRPQGLVHREYRLRAADGRDVWVLDDESVTQFADDGTPLMVQGVLVDISERKLAEQALQASEEQTRLIIETASYAFIGMDADGRVIDWNQRSTETFGWPRDEALGRLLTELIIPEADRAAHAEGLRRYLLTGEGRLLGQRVEVDALHQDGRPFPIELTIWPIHVGDEVRFNALVDDITGRKQLEDQLRHQALHDPLTGLANRALFADRVQHALARARRTAAESIAVLFLDLDDFKTVNDSLGHDAGDRLLKAVADRLRHILRREDTAARLGGDEFAVLLEGASPAASQQVAMRVLEGLAAPFEADGHLVSTRGSIGIAVSGEHGATPEELLRNADLAMYLAKARGKNRQELYESGMHEEAMRRLSMKRALEEAIAADQLEVHYQPIVALADGSIVGLEALLRWRGADGQFVPVPEVIAIAEETGLVLPIGRFVMERACRDARAWQEELGLTEALDIAINVSVVQLEHGTLLEDVERALSQSGLSPTSLVLEITEGALATDSLDSLRTIRALRARGIRLALDDFGTGYSSLARLRRFPVDVVKIDRSFVAAMSDDREGVLVQSIIDLGRTLDMEVVAEGIETERQLVALRARGVGVGQGFHFARPLPHEAVAPMLVIGRLPLPRRRRRAAIAKGA